MCLQIANKIQPEYVKLPIFVVINKDIANFNNF